MSMAYFTMYKNFINVNRINGMEKKLTSMLGYDLLTQDEYDDLMKMLKEKLNK